MEGNGKKRQKRKEDTEAKKGKGEKRKEKIQKDDKGRVIQGQKEKGRKGQGTKAKERGGKERERKIRKAWTKEYIVFKAYYPLFSWGGSLFCLCGSRLLNSMVETLHGVSQGKAIEYEPVPLQPPHTPPRFYGLIRGFCIQFFCSSKSCFMGLS